MAILKHCIPNGIPMMVQHNKTPFMAADRAKGIPLMISHKIFARRDNVPPPYSTSFPKGKNARDANLKHCVPMGMPTIVMHHKSPAAIQQIPCHIPPHKNHIKLPKQPIVTSLAVIMNFLSIILQWLCGWNRFFGQFYHHPQPVRQVRFEINSI